ncbi:MAG: hypothetical protein K2P86_13895 [Xanthobacteraceae bacterium]|nr:hypothetical protein [Xanthobacteraceae bacterium]
MRLVIVGTILAFAITAASAQAPKISGTKAFCLKDTDKVDCSFDTMDACQKGMKDKVKDSTSGGSCVSRNEAR